MKEDLLRYTKFLGPVDDLGLSRGKKCLESIGMKVHVAKNPETTEWAKIMNTTYYGLCIAYFQEVRRITERNDLALSDIEHFMRSTETESEGLIPRPVYRGGYIGGHCVIPNAHLFFEAFKSDLIREVIRSNIKAREQGWDKNDKL